MSCTKGIHIGRLFLRSESPSLARGACARVENALGLKAMEQQNIEPGNVPSVSRREDFAVEPLTPIRPMDGVGPRADVCGVNNLTVGQSRNSSCSSGTGSPASSLAGPTGSDFRSPMTAAQGPSARAI